MNAPAKISKQKGKVMATAPVLDIEPGTDIVAVVERDHSIVLFDTEKFDVWYEKLKAGAPTDVDMSTNKGREVVRSYAAKIRSEKAAIDRDRLRLTKEWRDMTASVNEAGKLINDRLGGLAEEVRKPLTEWEEAEKAREAECRAVIDGLKSAAVVTMDDTADAVRERGMSVWSTKIDPERFGDMTGEAEAAKGIAVETLKAALDRLTKEEADRAELAKLRAAEEERARKEAEQREAEEAERRRVEAERAAEERRIAAEKADAERIAAAEKEAAERAQREAEAAAQAERDRIEREHAEALAAERRRAEQAEAAAQAERDRVAAEQAEQAARDADKAHRSAVMKAAKEAIMTCGCDEETAKKIVLLIRSGEVPNVTLRF